MGSERKCLGYFGASFASVGVSVRRANAPDTRPAWTSRRVRRETEG